MTIEKLDFNEKLYVTTMEYEYAGMINALNYLCQEAEKTNLDLVSLHLNIAIAELKEHRLPNTRTG